MTAVQLNAKKLEIISLLMNTDDEKKVTEILNVARKADREDFEPVPGLAYTRQERLAEVDQAMKDYHAGRFIPHEEVFKPYRQWL
jgi:predicted transcriptional regulator